MAEKLDELYGSLTSGNSTQVTETIPGAVLSATRLSLGQLLASGASRSHTTVAGTDVSVSLPVALLAQLGEDAVLTTSAIHKPLVAEQTDASGEKVEVQGLVNIELSALSRPGEARRVSGLAEPIVISLGAKASRDAQCGYFDPGRKVWSTSGLSRVQSAGSGLTCASSHLTLFGGILKGFLAAFECSQASLLTAEGISKIAETDWHQHLPGQLFLGMFSLSALLGLVSVTKDYLRSRTGLRDESNFLVQQARAAAQPEEEEEPEAEDGRGRCGCCRELLGSICDVLKSILEEVVASLGDVCSLVLQMKDVLADICGGSDSGGGRSLTKMVVGVFTKLNMDVIHSVSAAKLHMAADDIEYLTSLAREHTAKQESSGSAMEVGVRHSMSGNSKVDDIAEQVVTQVQTDHARFNRCGGAPMLVWYLFAQRCTLIALMRYSLFISTSMSALLFVIDLVTASALAALFFQASGGAMAENVPAKCTPATFWEKLGQLIAVGMVTVIVGLIPSLVLSMLHQRDFVSCSRDQWERQLRLWKIQDRVIFVVGLSVIGFCFFFDLVFIANVTPDDGMGWFISCLTSMAQTLLAVPLLMTIITLSVVALSRCSRQVRHEVRLLCCSEGSQAEQSKHHRAPKSRWTPKSRLKSGKKEEEHHPEGILPIPSASKARSQAAVPEMPYDPGRPTSKLAWPETQALS